MKKQTVSQSRDINYINHICFIVDRSGSMDGLQKDVINVFDNQVDYLARRSKELNQETRVTTYLFDDKVECVFYDKDCLRLPSIRNFYEVGDRTALIDATLKAIDDLEKTPELYGNHSFLIYVISDGMNNINNHLAAQLSNRIGKLPDNWTLAFLAPNQQAVFEGKKFGFPSTNIQVWDVSVKGLKETGEVIRRATDVFMTSRSSGLRGTKNLFNLDVSNLTTNVVKNQLQELSPREYELLIVYQDAVIKPYVEYFLKTPYVKGSAYYLLEKPEKIQPYKNICIWHKKNGKVYTGNNARQLLNLPDFEVKVNPTQHPDYELFIQSTSLNRKLAKGSRLLVMK